MGTRAASLAQYQGYSCKLLARRKMQSGQLCSAAMPTHSNVASINCFAELRLSAEPVQQVLEERKLHAALRCGTDAALQG